MTSLLARIRILPKILAIIFVMSAISSGLSWLGIHALSSLNDDALTMDSAARRALQAARANTNVISINQAEISVAIDPRPENRSEARKVIDEQLKLFNERIEDAAKSRDEHVQAMMPGVRQAATEYFRGMEETLRLADAARDVQLSEQTERLRASAMKSRASAEKLRGLVRAVAEQLDKRVDDFSKIATAEYDTTSRWLVIVAIIGVVFGLTAGFVVGQYGVAKPIRAMVELLRKLAGGDFAIDVAGADRRDEIGEIAQAAIVFKDNGLAKIRLEQEQKESERHAAEQRKADMVKLADAFEGAVGEIIKTVSSASTEMEASARTLSSSAEKARELSTVVAAAAEEASTNVQSVASASEEMTSSVTEIGRQVQEAARISTEAVDQAAKTNQRVNQLSEAASRIGDVVELINTIAGQTNLLALNATIEAARAGDAGRGFAVVASEVKSLAEQTAKATDEIGEQIKGIQTATADSVSAIHEIGKTIARISEISSTIAAAVEEQGAATHEISRNVQQAAQGTTQVASNIADVQRGSSETGSASSQVLSAAQSLAHESNRLDTEVRHFLSNVRAA